MNLSIEKYLASQFENTQRTLAYDCSPDWSARAKVKLKQLIGSFDKPENMSYTVLSSHSYDGYELQKIIFEITDGLCSTAYMLLPDNSNGAAVAAIHGHGYGARDICALRPDGSDKAADEDPGYEINFAVTLAKLGFIVMAPEIIGFGDMRFECDTKAPGNSSCHVISNQMTMLGKTLIGLRTAQVSRCADILCSLENVDCARLGIMGISGGGMVTAFTSALDERFAASVICGYTNTFRGSILAMQHCQCNYVFNIWNYFDEPDIIGLIAPRPLFVEAGVNDGIFPIEHTRKAVEYIGNIYKACGIADMPEFQYFDGGHRVWGDESIKFLVRFLTGN